MESLWKNKFDIISGKELLNKFNNWCNSHYKTSVSANSLARELKKSEIPEEMILVVTAIEKNKKIE